MSEFTICNRCRYDSIVRRAKEGHHDVELKPQDGGQAVYVAGLFVAWFMELPDQCACG